MEKDLKKLEKWYRIFLILGLLGLIDITTRKLVQLDAGYVSLAVGYPFLILGSGAAGFVMTALSLIFDFSLIWLVLAWLLRRQIKIVK